MSERNDLEFLCRRVVQEMSVSKGWCLLSEEQFAQALLADPHLSPHSTPDQLNTLAINVYCRQALYPCCCGKHGPDKQNQAFHELSDYLYSQAKRTLPSSAEDATNDALLRIFTTMEKCRDPGAFLAFANFKLLDAKRMILREDERQSRLSVPEYQDIIDDFSGEDTSDGSPNHAVMASERHQELYHTFQQLQKKYPRRHRQYKAVWLRYIDDLNTEEIAKALATDSKNVLVLISRGLDNLRKEPLLLELIGTRIK
ncbi:MAG: sigma-70 family RNA polymerase sigma factor [Chloroflexota bacterium]